MTPRHVAGMIRRLPHGAAVCVQVTLSADRAAPRGTLLPIARAAALRMVRRLYGTGAKLAVSEFCGDLILGV
jgi:hypothetical protein